MGWNRVPVRDTQWKVRPYWTKQSQALEQDEAAGGREHRIMRDSGALARVILRRRNLRRADRATTTQSAPAKKNAGGAIVEEDALRVNGEWLYFNGRYANSKACWQGLGKENSDAFFSNVTLGALPSVRHSPSVRSRLEPFSPP